MEMDKLSNGRMDRWVNKGMDRRTDHLRSEISLMILSYILYITKHHIEEGRTKPFPPYQGPLTKYLAIVLDHPAN